MAEGTIQAGDFQLGQPIVVGDQAGAGIFQADFDISDILASIDQDDIIVFKAFKVNNSGGNLKQYANETITGIDLLAQQAQGVDIDELLLMPPVLVAEGYQTQCSVTWVAGTPKRLSWAYRNSLALV